MANLLSYKAKRHIGLGRFRNIYTDKEILLKIMSVFY